MINSQLTDERNFTYGDSKMYSISVIRLVAVVCIVSCHILQYYHSNLAFWFNVGVQIFFLISGFCYGLKTIEQPVEWLMKNFRKIYVPYGLFLVIVVCIYMLAAPDYINIIDALRLFTCTGTITGIGHLWFVGYILFCYFITIYLQIVRDKIFNMQPLKAGFIIAFIIILVEVMGVLLKSYYRPDKIICYIIGYYLSFFFQKYGFTFLKKIMIAFIPTTMVVCAVRVYCNYFVNAPIRGMSHIENLSQMCLGITIFISLFALFKNAKNNILLKMGDKYSYYVYLVHHIFILGPFSLISICDFGLNYILLFTSIFFSTVILYFISKKVEKFLGGIYEKSNVGLWNKT